MSFFSPACEKYLKTRVRQKDICFASFDGLAKFRNQRVFLYLHSPSSLFIFISALQSNECRRRPHENSEKRPFLRRRNITDSTFAARALFVYLVESDRLCLDVPARNTTAWLHQRRTTFSTSLLTEVRFQVRRRSGENIATPLCGFTSGQL